MTVRFRSPWLPALLLLTLFYAAAAGAAVRLVGPSERVPVRAGDDTLIVAYESLRVPFRPADYRTGDTIRFVLEDTTGGQEVLQIFAKADTLELRPTDTVIWVPMITVADTVLGKFVFIPIQPASHFVALIRKYSTYDDSSADSTLIFTYGDKSDSSLSGLRTQFRLDSIAGGGDEMSRVLNLLHWVHATVRHDGNAEVPQGYRPAELLARPASENLGVNCGVLAEIMNDVFLAAGFRSRRIVCLPYDTSDIECHSINAVWSPRLGQWVYVDPTFEGTFRNANGEYLSIAQVRQAMISGDSLVINDNLNWNGQPHDKGAYFRYMAKNLFRFACMTHSGPINNEQSGSVRRIGLDPAGYQSPPPGAADTSSAFTHHAVVFWAPPLK